MNQHRPVPPPVPGPRPEGDAAHDGPTARPERPELPERIGAALRAREPNAAVTAAAAQRIAATIDEAADERRAVVSPFVRRAGTFAVTGVVASALGVVGAGAAAAANPFTGFAAAVDGVAVAVGVDWSSMPDGYTRDQYDAFWGAGYTSADLAALKDLWQTGSLEIKARAGQMILDGEPVPVAPGTFPDEESRTASMDEFDAFRDAGYTADDAEELARLWQVDMGEAKARAGDMLLDGETPPLP